METGEAAQRSKRPMETLPRFLVPVVAAP